MPCTVLIADDDDFNRQMLLDVLADLPARGVTFLRAAEGLAAYEIAVSQQPDLILLDMDMPGMNGDEVCEKLKAAPDSPHIIMMTASVQSDYRRRALDAGADEFIAKPFDINYLRQRVMDVLGLAP